MQLRLDEKAKELFLLDISNKIQVYSIEGKYKRSLSIPKDVRIEIMYNCDEQHLLGYDSYMLDRKDKQPNSRPYLLISKKNGVVSRLPVTIHKRVGKRIYITQGGQTATVSMSLYPLANSGSEFIFADLAGDTVYSYCNHKLTPLFVRTPKADASEPRLVMQCYAKIGSYLLMSTALKNMNRGKLRLILKNLFMIRLRRKYMIWNLRIKTIRPPVQCEWEAYYRHYLKNVFSIRGILTVYWICWRKES